MLPRGDRVYLAPASIALVFRRIESLAAEPRRVSAERLFSTLRRSNASSPDAALRSAFRRLVLVGSLRPHTLLVHAEPDRLQVLRSAWPRNRINNPPGFTILHIGELGPVDIEPIHRPVSVLLHHTLLQIIDRLNQCGVDATIDSIKAQLDCVYAGAVGGPPCDQVVFEGLNELLVERRILLSDYGYLISNDCRLDVRSDSESSRRSKTTRSRYSDSDPLPLNPAIHDPTPLLSSSNHHNKLSNAEPLKRRSEYEMTDTRHGLRKFFKSRLSRKSRSRKPSSLGSTGSWSGSSAESPDEIEWLRSQTLALTVAESVQVNRGKTNSYDSSDSMIRIQDTNSDSEEADIVPEIQSLKAPRVQASLRPSCVLRVTPQARPSLRRQIGNLNVFNKPISNASISSEEHNSGTVSREPIPEVSNQFYASVRNSTKIDSFTYLEPNPPNVSTITRLGETLPNDTFNSTPSLTPHPPLLMRLQACQYAQIDPEH